jgi:hypothetical protein
MIIREAHLADSADIARLTVELGYLGDAEAMRERLNRIAPQRNQVVLVALIEARIVG